MTSIVILLGVRERKTKPKFLAADTKADSSGLCAWYSKRPSTYSGITVWHKASRRKKLWACISSERTASSNVLSYQRNSGSYSGFAEKSTGSIDFEKVKQKTKKHTKKNGISSLISGWLLQMSTE